MGGHGKKEAGRASKASAGGGISPEMEAKVASREAEIVNSPVENAFVLDAQGNVILDKKGTKHKVDYPESKMNKAADGIDTHNHPVPSSFSIQDIMVGSSYNVKQVRAVMIDPSGKRTRFTLDRPDKGWMDSKTLMDTWWRIGAQVDAKMKKVFPETARINPYSSNKKEVALLNERAWRASQLHNRLFARELGLKYKKETF